MLLKDEWLTSVIGKEAFKLDVNSIDKFEFSDFPSLPALITAKIPVGDLKSCNLLQKLNFSLISTDIQLQRNMELLEMSNLNIRFAEAKDEIYVEEIANSSFIYDRFHSDSYIKNDIAGKIKSEWVKNYFRNIRGDFMVVTEVNGIVSGFLQLLKDENNSLVIDLIAVKNNVRNMGIARAMVSFTIANFQAMNSIRVGTQLNNLPSLRLYTKLNFYIKSAYYIFHYHITI
ncbi:MAG: GNAT family N-acetyltransferase [Pelagibacteraceae bacterium]|nr:GNAT family N-acetyltransferase [Pelagibacteraceae bacterium]